MKKQVILTTDKIVGNVKKLDKVCNISSVPQWALGMITSNFPNSANTIAMYDIQARIVLNVDGTQIMHRQAKKTGMSFVVDSDDNNCDNKIKNICYMNNWKLETKIVVQFEQTCQNYKKDAGKMGVRLANHHHNNEMLKIINAKPISQNDANVIITAVVVKTDDDRCGSIAGLTHVLKVLKIPYIIEMCKVSCSESWVSTSKLLHKCLFETDNITSDIIPDGQKKWQHKLGYGDMVMTTKGIKRVNIKTKRTTKSKREKATNLFVKLWACIKRNMYKLMTFFGFRKGDHNNSSKENCGKTQKTSGDGSHVNQQQKNKQKKQSTNETRKERSKRKTKVAFTYAGIPNIATSVAMLYNRTFPMNASKDIKKANRLIADMQLSKMQTRSGLTGDKSLASQKRNPAFDAYLVGATSYGITDATTVSHKLAVKKRQSMDDKVLLLSIIITFIVCILLNNGIFALLSISIGLIAFTMKHINRLSAAMIVTALCSQSAMLVIFSLIVALVEELSLNKDTEIPRSVVYILTSCLILA